MVLRREGQRSTVGMELDDQYALAVTSHLQTAIVGEITRLFRFHLRSPVPFRVIQAGNGFCYEFFFGRPGGKASPIAAASVCNSKSPSCRWPFMKNVDW